MKLLVYESGHGGRAWITNGTEPGINGPYAIEVPDEVGARWVALQKEHDEMVRQIDRLIAELPYDYRDDSEASS